MSLCGDYSSTGLVCTWKWAGNAQRKCLECVNNERKSGKTGNSCWSSDVNLNMLAVLPPRNYVEPTDFCSRALCSLSMRLPFVVGGIFPVWPVQLTDKNKIVSVSNPYPGILGPHKSLSY